MDNTKTYISLSPLKITLIYLAVAILWISFTDQALEFLFSDVQSLTSFQTYKGWFYVLVTALGLYVLIKKYHTQITTRNEKLAKVVEQLRSEKELTGKLFDRIPVMLTMYDPNLAQFTVNKEFEKLTGWNKEQINSINLMEACYPDAEQRKAVVDFMNKPGDGWKEFPLVTKSGKKIDTSWTNIRLADDTQVGLGIDLTEIKASQAAIGRSWKMMKTVFERIPIGLAVQTIGDDKPIMINDTFTKIYGWPEKDITDSETFFRKVYPDKEYRSRIKSMIIKDIASKDPEKMSWKGITITTKKGEQKDVDAKNIPLYDQNLMISTVLDVTEQKELEEELRKSEEKYRHLFTKNPEPMWIYNPDTLAFVEVNEAAVNHYGYTEKEFLNMTLADIRPPKDVEAMKKDVENHRGRNSYSEDWIHRKKDGTPINVELSATDVAYNNATYRLVLVNDITEQKKVQEKIIQSAIEGEDRERKRISYELHDGLGQYLVAANMNFETVKSAIGDLSPKRVEQFNTGLSLLKKGLNETHNIAHNLMPQSIVDYGLITTLETLVHEFEKSTDITFDFNHQCEHLNLSDQVNINLYRICQETLSNSVRHADCEKISIALDHHHNRLELVIKDDGKGIAPHKSTEYNGLGLQSIQTRVTNLKGTLHRVSKPAKGTITTIMIPNIDTLCKQEEANG